MSPEPRFDRGIAAHVVAGNGPEVLWVHGYTIDSSLWQPLWRGLSDWSHIAIDLPGHGQSEPLGDESLPELGARLAEVAAQRGIRHIVGLSVGTLLALEVVLARPNAFTSLILGAPTYGGGPRDPAAGQRYKELQTMFDMLGPGPWLTHLWMTSPPDIFRHARRHPELWERLVTVVGRHSWAEFASGQGFQQLAAHDQDIDRARAVATAVLLLVGEYEMPAFKESARHLHARFAHSTIVELSGVGHLCMLEDVERSTEAMRSHWIEAEGRASLR